MSAPVEVEVVESQDGWRVLAGWIMVAVFAALVALAVAVLATRTDNDAIEERLDKLEGPAVGEDPDEEGAQVPTRIWIQREGYGEEGGVR